MEKIINVRKPPGPTSHDIVDMVRRATNNVEFEKAAMVRDLIAAFCIWAVVY